MKPMPALIPDPRLSEAFQSLRVQIELAARERRLQTIMVASPDEGDTPATVAGFLGAVFAQSGRRVVLVSADLHRPMLEAMFGVQPTPGLAEAAADGIDPSTILHRTWIPNLGLVPAGAAASHPADVLASPSTQQVLEGARSVADLVVVHAPPVLAGAEVAVLLPHCDGVVLVLEAGRTTAEAASVAKATVEKVDNGAILLGAVLGNVTDGRRARRYKKQRPLRRRDHGKPEPRTGPRRGKEELREPAREPEQPPTHVPEAEVPRPSERSGDQGLPVVGPEDPGHPGAEATPVREGSSRSAEPKAQPAWRDGSGLEGTWAFKSK